MDWAEALLDRGYGDTVDSASRHVENLAAGCRLLVNQLAPDRCPRPTYGIGPVAESDCCDSPPSGPIRVPDCLQHEQPNTRPDGIPALARLLVTDAQDRVLLVHTTGSRPRWIAPGGIVERGESPLTAARREFHEEVGLDIEPTRLLATVWAPASRPGRRSRLTFYFAGRRLTAQEINRISPNPTEVDGTRWADRGSARSVLPSQIAMNIGYPLDWSGTAAYIESRTPETL
ncbi:NUDIX hydrolase [Streptomyces triticagri]|uniref:NUDIX hydrolase n=2 Tax=Streptomyces triticagri TaxID=2293568 RepID=A0A372M306_9ACTN|nr:NUDIX hydrolase [Streptomyces triticagri]